MVAAVALSWGASPSLRRMNVFFPVFAFQLPVDFVAHGEMITLNDDDCVLQKTCLAQFVDEGLSKFVGAIEGLQRFVWQRHDIGIGKTAARDVTRRAMSANGGHRHTKGFFSSRTGAVISLKAASNRSSSSIPHGLMGTSQCVDTCRVVCTDLFVANSLLIAMRAYESVGSGKFQLCALHKCQIIAVTDQNIAETYCLWKQGHRRCQSHCGRSRPSPAMVFRSCWQHGRRVSNWSFPIRRCRLPRNPGFQDVSKAMPLFQTGFRPKGSARCFRDRFGSDWVSGLAAS